MAVLGSAGVPNRTSRLQNMSQESSKSTRKQPKTVPKRSQDHLRQQEARKRGKRDPKRLPAQWLVAFWGRYGDQCTASSTGAPWYLGCSWLTDEFDSIMVLLLFEFKFIESFFIQDILASNIRTPIGIPSAQVSPLKTCDGTWFLVERYRMHSFKQCNDALISAPSHCRSLVWCCESFRRSVPAQSTNHPMGWSLPLWSTKEVEIYKYRKV